MGSVVCGNAVHRAIGQAGQQRFTVFPRAKRRIHFVVGVVLADIFINQDEMMRRNLARDVDMLALGFADRLQCRCS